MVTVTLKHIANIKGDPGDRGPAGTFASVGITTIAAGEPARVVLSGPETAKHAQFFLPRGLPGVNGEVTDETLAVFVGSEDTETYAAVAAAAARVGIYALPAPLVSGASGATNRSTLQATVNLASSLGLGVLIPAGTFDIAGTVTLPAGMRVMGYSRDTSILRQTSKPSPILTVPANTQNVQISDLGFLGAGLDMTGTGSVKAYQEYVAIRAFLGTHGLTVRNIRVTDLYGGVFIRDVTDVTTTPTRIQRVEVDNVEASGVWSAVHGGPFLSPRITNIRGTYKLATTSDSLDVTHKPHLVYINTSNTSQGGTSNQMDPAWRTNGGLIDNIQALGGPESGAAAVTIKHTTGMQIGSIEAYDCPGILDLQYLRDVTIESAVSINDKYPSSGTESGAGSISMFTQCHNVVVKNAVIRYAQMHHGAALSIQNLCVRSGVERLQIVANRLLATSTIYEALIAGTLNGVGWLEAVNDGAPVSTAVVRFIGTGARGYVNGMRVSSGWRGKVRVEAAHSLTTIAFDPFLNVPDREIADAYIVSDASGTARLRDLGVGQKEPVGFTDAFTRTNENISVTATDNLKPWTVTGGNPSNWFTVAGMATNGPSTAWTFLTADAAATAGVLDGRIGDPGNRQGGLIGWFTDADNYLAVDLQTGTGDNRVRLRANIGGTSTVLATAEAAVAATSKLSLVIIGNQAAVRIDDTAVIPLTTVTGLTPTTRFGLYGRSTSGTRPTWDGIAFT